MKGLWITVRGVWSEHPLVDWVVVAAVGVVHMIITSVGPDVLVLMDLDQGDRMRVYTTVASVSALLFGFATASIAFFYGSAGGERVNLMKQVNGPSLLRSWRAALSSPLVAVGACIVALVADAQAEGSFFIAAAVEVSILLLAVRGIRLRWLFASTLSLVSLDNQSLQQYAPAPEGGYRSVEPPRRKAEHG